MFVVVVLLLIVGSQEKPAVPGKGEEAEAPALTWFTSVLDVLWLLLLSSLCIGELSGQVLSLAANTIFMAISCSNVSHAEKIQEEKSTTEQSNGDTKKITYHFCWVNSKSCKCLKLFAERFPFLRKNLWDSAEII